MNSKEYWHSQDNKKAKGKKHKAFKFKPPREQGFKLFRDAFERIGLK